MSIVDAFQDDTDQAIALMGSTMAPPKPVEKKTNYWGVVTAPFRALPAAAAESLAGAAELATSTLRTYNAAKDLTTAQRNALGSDGVKVSGETEASRSLRNVAEDYRPDPLTASTAETIVYGLTKGISKAVGYTLAAGPIGGAAAFGADEGLTAYDELQRKGVDNTTAAQVGALTGVASGAGILVPGFGSTVAKTVALTAAAGPGLFIAQQAATSELLKRANYGKIAEGYDPLDPVGLAVATLIPAAFGGLHVAKLGKTSREATDAAMVQNLTIQQDARAGEPVPATMIDTPPPPAEPAQATKTDTKDRTAAIEQANPEAATEIQRVRQLAQEGSDTELGRADADLLRVAAECSLT